MIIKILTLLLLVLTSAPCFPQDVEEEMSFSDYFFILTPWESPLKNWPLRISTISLNLYKPSHELDIINKFGHHLLVKSNSQNQFSLKVAIQFFRLFDFWFRFKKEEIQFQQSESFQLNKNKFDFTDHQLGFGTNFNFIRLELGMGKVKSVTFLQTDTSLFYILPFKASYISYNIQVLIPTKLGFQIISQFNGKSILPTEDDSLKIEKGAGREFLTGLVIPFLGLQFIPYYSFSDENFKFTHKFYGLENEMSNKISYQRLGINLTIPF